VVINLNIYYPTLYGIFIYLISISKRINAYRLIIIIIIIIILFLTENLEIRCITISEGRTNNNFVQSKQF